MIAFLPLRYSPNAFLAELLMLSCELFPQM